MPDRKMKKAAGYLLIAGIWLAVWEIASLSVGQSILLPSVADTVSALIKLCGKSETWISVASSVLRVTAGLVAGMLTGCILGSVCAFSKYLNDFFTPLITVIKATPVASFIILAFVWIPTGYVPVFTSFLIVTPIFYTNVFTALKNTDKNMLELAQVYRMPFLRKIWEIYVPSAVNAFTGALVSSVGMGWKASVAAEVICRNRQSIGGSLYSSKISLDTSDVFAWTLIVIVLSLIFEKTAVYLIGRISAKGADGNGQ